MRHSLIQQFLDYLKSVRNASPHTLRNYKTDLGAFTAYLETRKIELINVTNLTIREWQATLLKTNSKATRARKLATLKSFFHFLQKEQIIRSDPTLQVGNIKRDFPREENLSSSEARLLLTDSRAAAPIAMRDQAILELLYAAGITVSELINLDLQNLDLDNQLLQVVSTNRQRILPIGFPAKTALKEYLSIRNSFSPHPARRHKNALFLSDQGARLSARSIGRLVTKYTRTRLSSSKHVNPRMLRRSFAIHLAANGADAREIQTLLGHAQISTTSSLLKTHLTPTLVKAYEDSHPAQVLPVGVY